ncbi:sodium channel protein Nach-like [Diorhabda sublineata]|uniref:sodium channel protein Nach-like n=1 Tax=Diorhabda sublineata TaxID=1163346 RepID=UPI0024E047B3|nr:sodium channel protein Nach-like [Diorhabda sublineata]
MFKAEIKQFCLSTALHGYKFIVLPKRTFLERCFWITICLLALLTALTLFSLAYTNVQNYPMITVTDSNNYPIWHYDFPAVTICNHNKISKKKATILAKKLTQKYNIDQEEVTQHIKLLYYLYEYKTHTKIPLANLTNFQYILDSNNIVINKQLSDLAPTCEDFLVKCIWKGESQRCGNVFQRISTSYGYCCSFNLHALRNSTIARKDKYQKNPRRVSGCTHETGLELLVNNKPKDYFASSFPAYGVDVLIHSPYTIPDWNLQNNLIQMKTVNFLGLTPSITYCTKEVLDTSVEKRKCWYSHERNLIYYKRYNFNNCMVECRMNLTIQLCHCVPFFFIPNENNYATARLCNLKDVKCLTLIADMVKSSMPGFVHSGKYHISDMERGNCNCLPDCQTIDYTIESSQGVLSTEFSTNHLNVYTGIKLVNHSVIRIYFNDLVGTKNRTDVRFNWHSLIAYFGGLLGLSMGFSLISAMEIVYFLSTRVLTTIKTKNNSEKKINPHLKNNKNSVIIFY